MKFTTYLRTSPFIEDLPYGLADALVKAKAPYRHGPAARKKIREAKAKTYRRKWREWRKLAELRADLKPRGVYWKDQGRMARVLELSADWVTFYELRIQCPDIVANGLKQAVHRLWTRGQLLKRKNPDWQGPIWVQGVARCRYQYKRASEIGDAKDEDDTRRGDEVKQGGQEG